MCPTKVGHVACTFPTVSSVPSSISMTKSFTTTRSSLVWFSGHDAQNYHPPTKWRAKLGHSFYQPMVCEWTSSDCTVWVWRRIEENHLDSCSRSVWGLLKLWHSSWTVPQRTCCSAQRIQWKSLSNAIDLHFPHFSHVPHGSSLKLLSNGPKKKTNDRCRSAPQGPTLRRPSGAPSRRPTAPRPAARQSGTCRWSCGKSLRLWMAPAKRCGSRDCFFSHNLAEMGLCGKETHRSHSLSNRQVALTHLTFDHQRKPQLRLCQRGIRIQQLVADQRQVLWGKDI